MIKLDALRKAEENPGERLLTINDPGTHNHIYIGTWIAVLDDKYISSRNAIKVEKVGNMTSTICVGASWGKAH